MVDTIQYPLVQLKKKKDGELKGGKNINGGIINILKYMLFNVPNNLLQILPAALDQDITGFYTKGKLIKAQSHFYPLPFPSPLPPPPFPFPLQNKGGGVRCRNGIGPKCVRCFLSLQDYLVKILLKEARTEPSEGARYEALRPLPPLSI